MRPVSWWLRSERDFFKTMLESAVDSLDKAKSLAIAVLAVMGVVSAVGAVVAVFAMHAAIKEPDEQYVAENIRQHLW